MSAHPPVLDATLSHVIYVVLGMPPDGPFIKTYWAGAYWARSLTVISCASLAETLIDSITLMTMDAKHTYHIC